MHYSTGGVGVPGGTTHYYIDTAVPTASTPTVTSALQVNTNASVDLPTFTATAFPVDTTLERLVNITVNVSANQAMNACANLTATLSRIDASGIATTLGTGTTLGATIPQGSGGGLQGYAALVVATDLSIDRTIPAGNAIRVKVTVSNLCNSNRSVRLVFDGTVSTGQYSRGEFSTPDVTVYGAPGTFGDYTGTLSNNITLARSSVSSWALDPGQAFWNLAVSSDGNVFVSNFPQTFSQLDPTACDVAITCLNPSSKQCPTASGGADFFSTIRIPTHTGALYVPQADCSNASYAGGSDVADIQRLQTADGERMMFISSLSSAVDTGFPVLGRLSKQSGSWALEMPRYLADLASDPAGSLACPGNPPNCSFMNAIAQLPGSGHVVVAQYAGPSIGVSVMDTSGHLLASSGLPSWVDANNCGLGIVALPVKVAVDPSSASSCGASGCTDERFVITYDPAAQRDGTVQEFRYNSSVQPPTIEAVSAPILVTSASYPSNPCATGANYQGAEAGYDHEGNLWVIRNPAVSGDAFNHLADIFVRDPVTGKRRTETDPNCKANGNLWGLVCQTDIELTGMPNAPLDMVEDPTTGTMIITGYSGKVVRVNRIHTQMGEQFVRATTVIDLGLSNLPPLPPEFPPTMRGLSDQAVDDANRLLWLSTQIEEGTSGTYPNQSYVKGAVRGGWMFAIDLARVLNYP